MVTDKGILTETPAMLAFIAQSFPRSGLAPLDGPFAFAQVQAFNRSVLDGSCGLLTACAVMLGRRPAAIAAMQRKAPQSVGVFPLIEHEMLKGPWVMGEAYTIWCLFVHIVGWQGRRVDLTQLSR
jgi:glutathione S-transferase